MYKTLAFALVLACVLSGCATVNFSANYYKPPEDYQAEVNKLWCRYLDQAALSSGYRMHIVSDRECMGGIPQIEQTTVKLPDNFIKYVYQNYYESRSKVLLCISSHEIAHNEYRLFDQSNPRAHFQVDQKAIDLIKARTRLDENDYYKSLMVVKDYWFARKGLGGHMFNLGWNLASAASMYYGGPSCFRDWFATDLNGRLSLMAKYYHIRSGSRFQRSSGNNRTIRLQEQNFEPLFLAKDMTQ